MVAVVIDGVEVLVVELEGMAVKGYTSLPDHGRLSLCSNLSRMMTWVLAQTQVNLLSHIHI